jgi:hypothetical protein
VNEPRGFRCSQCGEWHEGLPLAYGPEAPVYWYGLTADERASRFVLESDYAVLDGQHFFVRGALRIPIHGHDKPFTWVAWVSLSPENYARFVGHPAASSAPVGAPMFGWLSSELEGYPSTVNLKANVHQLPQGQRPIIELEPTDHPLAVEQREGITWQRVQEIAQVVLHATAGA